MSVLVIIFGLGLIFSAWLFLSNQLRVGPAVKAMREIRIESHTPLETLTDPLSMEIRWAIDQLMPLNFKKFALLTLQHVPETTAFPNKQYMVVDSSGHVLAEIIYIRTASISVGLSTWFGDDSTVSTTFPMGVARITPNYVYQTVTTTLAETYRLHQTAVFEHSRTHGDPRPAPIDDTPEARQEFERRERYFIANYLPMRGADTLRQNMIVMVTYFVCGLAFVLGGIAFMISSQLAFYLTIVVTIFSFVLSYVSRRYLLGMTNMRRDFLRMRQALPKKPAAPKPPQNLF